MTHPNLDPFLGRLKRVSKTRDGWKACCPAHDDHEPSLSVAIGRSGGIVVHCFSQHCTAEAIAAAVGMELLDFAPDAGVAAPASPAGELSWDERIEATYDYHDADGQVVYQEVRLHSPKDFRLRAVQERASLVAPDGRVYSWKLPPNLRRVPYRLPELLAAGRGGWVFVVEGSKKAKLLTGLGLLATTNAGGAGKWHTLNATAVDQAFRGLRVAILPDRDAAGYRHAVQVAQALAPLAVELKVVELPGLALKGDVVDWLAADPANPTERLMTLVQLAPHCKPPDGQLDATRIAELAAEAERLHELAETAKLPKPAVASQPTVQIIPEEHLVVAGVIQALATDPDLYHRGDELVHVVADEPDAGDRRLAPSGAPRVRHLPEAALRTRVTRCCNLVQETRGKILPVHPPRWLAPSIAAAGRWPGLRRLHGVTEAPILRSDGSVVELPGYDQQTAMLYLPSAEFPAVPKRPTRDDARAAADRLLDLLCDFPLELPAHKSAWLAGLLTPLARRAFIGPAPLFLANANVPGAGKGLLLDLISAIVTGRPFARAGYVCDAVEMAKVVTAVALAGEPLVLLDNVAGRFGDAALDAALTSTETSHRLLGTNRTPRLPLLATWFATGNNVTIAADLIRRVCPIQLESLSERPDTRDTGTLRFPRLDEHVRRHRGAYLVDALTILSAFIRAGRPQSPLPGWGSFEGWSDLVRQAVVWIGLADPDTRERLAEQCDTDTREIRLLLAGWRDVAGTNAISAREALKRARDHPGIHETWETAIVELFGFKRGEPPTPREVGYRLRKYARRVLGDQRLVGSIGHGGITLWRVETVTSDGGHGGHDSRSSRTTDGAGDRSGGGHGCDGGDATGDLHTAHNGQAQAHIGGGLETPPPSQPYPPPLPRGELWEELT